MTNRLQVLTRSINSEPKYVDSSFDYLIFETFLTPEENVLTFLVRISAKTWEHF